MKAFLFALITFTGSSIFIGTVTGADLKSQAWDLERKGDAAGARELLQRSVQSSPTDVASLEAYAEFLDRHKDPATRDTYEKVLLVADKNRSLQSSTNRRLAVLDILAGDRSAAAKHLEGYRRAGGTNLTLPQLVATERRATIEIPGPMRSFSRMAALSPDMNEDDLLTALARNVVTNGYQAGGSVEGLEQTEYLKLIIRYLSQARELEKLAGADKMIRIETCDSTQTGELLRVIGYRMRGACGSDVVLETVNSTRAFLTIDSGFPLSDLEASLRANRPFIYDYHPTRAPILYGSDYWLSAKDKQSGEFIDSFLGDPSICRLYLGLSKLDPPTADELRKSMSATKIKAFSHVIDFFGGMFQIRDGRAVTPGGPRSEKAWADLAGASPEKGALFFEKLVARDDGWLASYFDSLARCRGAELTYLTEPERMKRFYAAMRGKVTSPGPARPVFRSNTELMLLTTRLRIDSDGRAHIPGGVEVWKGLFQNHPHGKYDGKLTKSAANWKEPDDVLEALFGLCRKVVENEPLKIFLAISDVNRNRPKPLELATVDRMARDFRIYGAQYSLFSEVPTISDRSIVQYLDTAKTADQIHDGNLRADTIGSLQALISLWQIACRRGAIAASDADATFAKIIDPFATKIHNQRDLFDGSRASIKLLLAAAHSRDGLPQDQIYDLLSGSSTESETRTEVVQQMIRVFESQRLVSLDTLFALADNLESVARGEKLNNALVVKLASRIGEIQLPRSSMSTTEKNSMAFGYWTEKHIEIQRKINLRSSIEKAGSDPEKLRDLRGQLAPFLRDTLVGFSYVHYAPPAAQILQTNPLFVRSHDFIGIQGASTQSWKNTEVFGSGWPSSAGGRLSGSLCALPYALAEAEQNFFIPSREQALIWGDLVPQMILSATVPRWWEVSAAQMHWVGMHMSYGENLLAEASLDAAVRAQVTQILAQYAPPARVYKIDRLLMEARTREALDQVIPSELFLLAATATADPKSSSGPLAADIRRLAAESPDQINYRVIGRAFGTPKPTLSNSYQPDLLNLRTFPTLMGYSSRILAESWESNLLFYAALADEVYLPPSQLNVVIPQWTQQTVERIFATHLEDWPALLRSLRTVGEDVRQKARKQMTTTAELK